MKKIRKIPASPRTKRRPAPPAAPLTFPTPGAAPTPEVSFRDAAATSPTAATPFDVPPVTPADVPPPRDRADHFEFTSRSAFRADAVLPPALRDMKEARTSARKADLTHMRTPFLTYGSRACEYGGAKYERANYLRPTASITDDFIRLRTYLRASVAHTLAVLDAMELHQATDPGLTDVDGMKLAAFCADTDEDVSGKVGPSGLPHLCGAVASLNMAITQATRCGLLPADPGQPWAATAAPSAGGAVKCRVKETP